jgi:hypothetical protein
MKYKVNRTYQDSSFDVITEDGGVASIHHNGNNFVTTYYPLRLGDCDMNWTARNYFVWSDLSNHKTQFKDWVGEHWEPLEIEMILDALDWLVFPKPIDGWEQDQTIWTDFFPNLDLKQCIINSLSNTHCELEDDDDNDAFKDIIEDIIFGLEEIQRNNILKSSSHINALHDAIIIAKTIIVHV